MYRVTRPGGYVLVNVAAMESLRGDHSVLSHEVRRYSRASLSRLVERSRLHHRPNHLHECGTVSADGAAACSSAGAASPPEADAASEISVPPAPVNLAADGGAAARKPVAPGLDNPFGSSLLCLARKPA